MESLGHAMALPNGIEKEALMPLGPWGMELFGMSGKM
jgi:hypothetical protein